MTDEQLTELFKRHFPQQPVPNEIQQRVAKQVLSEVRALASGRVDLETREIVIVPAKEGAK